MSPYKPNLAVNSGANFKCCICDPRWNSRKLGLLLSLKRPLSERFQAVAGEEISHSKKPYVPDNTRHSTGWAVRMFEQWRDFYSSKRNESECPCDILMTEDKEVLCHWLCTFIMEVKKEV